MKKAGRLIGGTGAVLLVVLVLALLSLKQLESQRSAGFGPLSEEVLQQIVQDRIPGSIAPHAGPNSDTDSAPSVALKSGAEAGEGTPQRDNPPRLARTLTREELMSGTRSGSHPLENASRYLTDRTIAILESLAWARGGDPRGQLAFDAGMVARRRGDIESARSYLRAALERSVESGDDYGRNYILSELAVVEEDLELATVCLEASCAASSREEEYPHQSFLTQKALCHSILTGSDDLAEHYYRRWSLLEPDGRVILDYRIRSSPVVTAWLEARDPDFYDSVRDQGPLSDPAEVEE